MPLIRPVRIAARRQCELMAVIAVRESEDIEWVHEEEDLLEITEISVPTDNQHKSFSFCGAFELTMGGSCWSYRLAIECRDNQPILKCHITNR